MNLSKLIDMQGMMFILMFLGLFLRKKKIVPEATTGILTEIVLDVALPCSIITSFQVEFSMDTIQKFVLIIIISILIQFGTFFMGKFIYRKQPHARRMVLEYATAVSNAGLLGTPVAGSAFGPAGLMYASVYMLPQRIVMWSAGVSLFTDSPSKKEVIKKVMTHPCIVAIYIGLFLMFTQLPLPSFLQITLEGLGDCSTALSMILIGTILSEVDFKKMLNKTLLSYTALRLVIIPFIVLICCRVAGVDKLIAGISVLLAAMPAASTTAMLAKKYDGDYIFATECVVFTTLLTLVTIPVWRLFL